MLKKVFLILESVIFTVTAYSQAQDKVEVEDKNKVITLNGYVSTLQTAIFDSLSGPFVNENVIHNRLNFRGYINENITVAAEFRNRLFTGDMVKLGSSYTGLIEDDPGFVNMSWNLIKEQSVLLNTRVDRLWLDLHYNKFQITLGRQRINWGQTLVWNPNDIFNAYSFFDIDYVERPGSDALRMQYFPSSSSAAELAMKIDNYDNITAAGLFRFNAGGYDIQFLAGLVNSEDVVIGTGWSGSVGSVSFRGEASWFQPYEEFPKSLGTILATAGADKVFRNNSSAQVQLMYCNNPADLSNFYTFFAGSLSSKELALSRFTAFGQYSWQITPLFNLSLSAMWFPDLYGYYAGPSLEYSIAQNVDFSMIWQHFDATLNGYWTRINLGFLRFKVSF
jgi:hypothetical protein